MDTVMVLSYTGEYAQGFVRLAPWAHVYDREVFMAGLTARGGEEDDSAWGEWLSSHTDSKILADWAATDYVSVAIVVSCGPNALTHAVEFADMLKVDVTSGYCGDDQHYDYYPDAMDMLYQLCKAINSEPARRVYETSRQYAWDVHYKEDTEYGGEIDRCFRKWEG